MLYILTDCHGSTAPDARPQPMTEAAVIQANDALISDGSPYRWTPYTPPA